MARVWQKRGGCMRLVSINVNGVGDEEKRLMIEKFCEWQSGCVGSE